MGFLDDNTDRTMDDSGQLGHQSSLGYSDLSDRGSRDDRGGRRSSLPSRYSDHYDGPSSSSEMTQPKGASASRYSLPSQYRGVNARSKIDWGVMIKDYGLTASRLPILDDKTAENKPDSSFEVLIKHMRGRKKSWNPLKKGPKRGKG